MFINCSGQGGLDSEAYPFKSLTENGTVSDAVAQFRNRSASAQIAASEVDNLVERGGRTLMRSGGVAIDGYYRLVGEDGSSNERIHDIAFPHATGVRPYSYGLQACDAAASIVVQSWCTELSTGQGLSAKVSAVTSVYEEVPEPSERAQ